MIYNDFKQEMSNKLRSLGLTLNDEQIHEFFCYMNDLVEKNKVMNLTSIIEPKDIILKHFIDSLSILKYIKNNESVIDIGSGAGFPGIPLKIANKSLDVCLLDSLNKRISFLDETINKMDLSLITAIHGRAEEYGQNPNYREKYDVVVSRAVAPLNILLEYMLPFSKVNGKCICMKGNLLEEEISNCQNALQLLGGKVEKIERFNLAETENSRTIVVVKKVKSTPKTFPRNPGTPAKKPL